MKSHMNLYLLRHGESAEQLGEEIGSDSPLSVRGRRQAEEAGVFLSRLTFDQILVSPFRRTQETLELLKITTREPPLTDGDLVENEGGIETIMPRVTAVEKRLRQCAENGLHNVLIVSHCMFLSDLLIFLMTGDLENRRNIYIRLSNARLGLLRINREAGIAAVLSGWNIDAATAVEYEKVLYP